MGKKMHVWHCLSICIWKTPSASITTIQKKTSLCVFDFSLLFIFLFYKNAAPHTQRHTTAHKQETAAVRLTVFLRACSRRRTEKTLTRDLLSKLLFPAAPADKTIICPFSLLHQSAMWVNSRIKKKEKVMLRWTTAWDCEVWVQDQCMV